MHFCSAWELLFAMYLLRSQCRAGNRYQQQQLRIWMETVSFHWVCSFIRPGKFGQTGSLFQRLYSGSLLMEPYYLDIIVLYKSCTLMKIPTHAVCNLRKGPESYLFVCRAPKVPKWDRESCYTWPFRDQHRFKLLAHQDKESKGRKQ